MRVSDNLARVWPSTRYFFFQEFLKGLAPSRPRRTWATNYERNMVVRRADAEAFDSLIKSGDVGIKQARELYPEKFNSLRGLAELERHQGLFPGAVVGFKARWYRSGEVTGAQFRTGSRCKVIPALRSGEVVTEKFTDAARKKIRRAAECAELPLSYFITLTFAPADLAIKFNMGGCDYPFDSNGNIDHKFAKKELKRFLNTCSKTVSRKGRTFAYIWVAELQKNGNIHFHILCSERLPIKWITKIWGQAKNSVDVQYINNSRHAVNYMRKYMTKDDGALIRGNRYNISAELRGTMKPEEFISTVLADDLHEGADDPGHRAMDVIKAMKEEIEAGGGHVLDFGFHFPAPRRSQRYRDRKTGEMRRTKGISAEDRDKVLMRLFDEQDDSPF